MDTSARLHRGLRGYINRFSHTVINVSDLDRAVELYEATFPVRRRMRINGPAHVTPEELRAFARDNLAHFKGPTAFHIVEELPETATGKIQKFVLRGSRAGIAAQ